MSDGARSSALTPFRVRSFRFQWPADLLTSWAIEMEVLILGWYILVETRSVLLLTLFGALQYLGTLISPLLGVLGDRFGHRNVLCGMRAIYATLAASLLILAYGDALTPAGVFLVGTLCGLVRPSDLAMRAALVAQVMPPEHLIAAMGVSRTTSDSARVAGALAGAGLFAALGIGPAYMVVTCLYLVGLLLTLGVAGGGQARASSASTATRGARLAESLLSPLRDLKAGLLYVWTTPHLNAGMWLAFLVNLTAFPLTGGLLPYVAREVYRIDQTGLGTLVASFAFGALIGSIALSFVGQRLRQGRASLIAALVWYALLVVFAQTRSLAEAMPVLMLAGCAQSFSMIPLATMLLRTSAPPLRGRVMGVRMLAIYSLPLGLLAAGWLIGWIGFRATATLYSLAGLALTLAIIVRWRASMWRREAPANAL